MIDGEEMVSVEGFIQGIKFPEGSSMRRNAFQSSGFEAKKLGKGAGGKFVWWRGRVINYGSSEHHELIEQAIRAKFQQNKEAMQALLATQGLELIHDLGEPESPNTSLPAKIFCEILTKIREEI